MESIKKRHKYEKILLKLLQEWASPQDQILIDKTQKYYQILRTGFDSDRLYFFRVRMHFSIREDGKICIWENQTDIEIGDDLIALGIPKSDILPAFLPTDARKLVGYAV